MNENTEMKVLRNKYVTLVKNVRMGSAETVAIETVAICFAPLHRSVISQRRLVYEIHGGVGGCDGPGVI